MNLVELNSARTEIQHLEAQLQGALACGDVERAQALALELEAAQTLLTFAERSARL